MSQAPTRLALYQVDAFTDRPFAGNPAAVCPLDHWLPDATLQAIAAENNLSETAFFVPRDAARADLERLGPAGSEWDEGQGGDTFDYALRWFTPRAEVDLCGHATLAAAWVILEHPTAVLDHTGSGRVRFLSRSGPLAVERDGERLALDFPSRPPGPLEKWHPEGSTRTLTIGEVTDALGAEPREVRGDRDLLAVFETEAEVEALAPDMRAIEALQCFAIIASAPARAAGVDFVSRFFAPAVGVPEDPVTGSAHSTLVPYWAKKLGKAELRARQISERGGDLWCIDRGDRVSIAGHACLTVEGTFLLGSSS